MASHPRPEDTPPGAPPHVARRQPDARDRPPRDSTRLVWLAVLAAAVLATLATYACNQRIPPGDSVLTPDQ